MKQRPRRQSAKDARGTAQDSVRPNWVGRVVDVTQVLGGSFQDVNIEALKHALTEFEGHFPPAKTTAEHLVLRGILLDVFLRLEKALGQYTSASDRAKANALLRRARPEATFSVFLECARQLLASAVELHAPPLHERARRWIEERIDERCSVEEIARQLETHPRTLRRIFKKHFGQTPHQYRAECRAARAEKLLSGTTLKVEAVATAIGVGSKATLYRVLHRFGRPGGRRK